jgi:hypothetical protein
MCSTARRRRDEIAGFRQFSQGRESAHGNAPLNCDPSGREARATPRIRGID